MQLARNASSHDSSPSHIEVALRPSVSGLSSFLILSMLAFGPKATASTMGENLDDGKISVVHNDGPTISAEIDIPVNGYPLPEGLTCSDFAQRSKSIETLVTHAREFAKDIAPFVVTGGAVGQTLKGTVISSTAKQAIDSYFSSPEVPGPIDTELLRLKCAAEGARNFSHLAGTPTNIEVAEIYERQFEQRQRKVQEAWENQRAEIEKALPVDGPLERAMFRSKSDEYQLLQLGKLWNENELAKQTSAREKVEREKNIAEINERLAVLEGELVGFVGRANSEAAAQFCKLTTASNTISNAINEGIITRREVLELMRPDLATRFSDVPDGELRKNVSAALRAESQIKKALADIKEFEDWSYGVGSVVSIFNSRAGHSIQAMGSAMGSIAALGVVVTPLAVGNAVNSVVNLLGFFLNGGRDIGAERHQEAMEALKTINENVNRLHERIDRIEDILLNGFESTQDRFDAVDRQLSGIYQLVNDTREVSFEILRAVGVSEQELEILSRTFQEHDAITDVGIEEDKIRGQENARRDFDTLHNDFIINGQALPTADLQHLAQAALSFATVVSNESAFTMDGSYGLIALRTRNDEDTRQAILIRRLLLNPSADIRGLLLDSLSDLVSVRGGPVPTSSEAYIEGASVVLDLIHAVGMERAGISEEDLQHLYDHGIKIQGTSGLFVQPEVLQAALDDYDLQVANLIKVMGGYLADNQRINALPSWNFSYDSQQFLENPHNPTTLTVSPRGLSAEGREFMGSHAPSAPKPPTDRVKNASHGPIKNLEEYVRAEGLSIEPQIFALNDAARMALAFRGDPSRYPELASLLCSVSGDFTAVPIYPSEETGTYKKTENQKDEGEWGTRLEGGGKDGKDEIPVWREKLVKYTTYHVDYKVHSKPLYSFVLGRSNGEEPLGFLSVEVTDSNILLHDTQHEETRQVVGKDKEPKTIQKDAAKVEHHEEEIGKLYVANWEKKLRPEIEGIITEAGLYLNSVRAPNETLTGIKIDKKGRAITISGTLTEGENSRNIKVPTTAPLPKHESMGQHGSTGAFPYHLPPVDADFHQEPPSSNFAHIKLTNDISYRVYIKWNPEHQASAEVKQYERYEQLLAETIAHDAVTPGTPLYRGINRTERARAIIQAYLNEGGMTVANESEAFSDTSNSLRILSGRGVIETQCSTALLAKDPARVLVKNICSLLTEGSAKRTANIERWRSECPSIDSSLYGDVRLQHVLSDLKERIQGEN